MDPNENDPYSQLITPCDRSHAPHPSPPFIRSQTMLPLNYGSLTHHENNPYCQLIIPGDSSRAPHLSPPFIGGQTMLRTNHGFGTYHDERMNSILAVQDLDMISHPNLLGEEEIHVNVREELSKMSHYNLPPQMNHGFHPYHDEMNSRSVREDLGIMSNPNLTPRNDGSRTYNDEMINNRFVSIPFQREEMHFREELGKMSHYNLPPQSLPLPDQNIQARYQLQFINKVRHPTYTTKPVRDNNVNPIRVEIYDSNTRSRVSPYSFLSSVKVRIIVLDADFWKNRVNRSRSEFVQNELRGREGKEPILNGHGLTIRLENGVGTFPNLVFRDNSSWTKSGFRLGVMVDGEDNYNLTGERVQEGVSEPFQVRDRRTEASQKPKQLKLMHGVKCIKNIGKDRASLLQKKNINTVEDFLKFFYIDEVALREILGIKSEYGKEWRYMVEHVEQCAVEYHAKYNASNNSSQSWQASVRPVVGLESSEPNPLEGQSFSMWDHGHWWNNAPFERFSNENGDSIQPTNGDVLPQCDSGNYGSNSCSFFFSDSGAGSGSYGSGGGYNGGSYGSGGGGYGGYSGGSGGYDGSGCYNGYGGYSCSGQYDSDGDYGGRGGYGNGDGGASGN